MRELIIGAAVISAAGLGVFFYPSAGPAEAAAPPPKIYPLTVDRAQDKLDKTESLLNRLKFGSYVTYNVMSGPNGIEFVGKSTGSKVVCEALIEEAEGGVTVDGWCLGGEADTPVRKAQKQVADLTLREFIDSVLSDRPFNQGTVMEGIERLDLGKLTVEQQLALRTQARLGDAPPYRPPNGQWAKDYMAREYNAENGGDDWSTEAVVD